MKTTLLIAAASLAFTAAATAFAGTGEADNYEYPAPSASTQSRAAVKAELLQARQQGLIAIGEADWPQVAFSAQKTRAQVKAETLAAIASGELRAFNAEPYSADHTPVARVSATVVTAAK